MRNLWNTIGAYRFSSKKFLPVMILTTLFLGLFSTTSMVSAHASAAPDNNVLMHQSAQSMHCAQTVCSAVHPNGTNGQQLALWIGSSLLFESVAAYGTNQNGDSTSVCFVGPNGTAIAANQWHYYGGYWWVGNVSLHYYTGTGCSGTDAYDTATNVPGYNAWSDYWCFSLRTSLDPTPGSC